MAELKDVAKIEITKSGSFGISQFRDILMECHDDAKNTHKYYHIHVPEEHASNFSIEYGRVGHSPNKLQYPVSDLWTKFNEKMRKGYKVLKISRWDERGTNFTEFLDKFLNGGDDCWLPE
jgi:predicted DNA-binding WGR domain protein